MHVEEEEQMCDIPNQYLSAVFTFERPEGLMGLENRRNQKNVTSNLSKVLIAEEIVYIKIIPIDSNKAHGDYDTGSLTLKELANDLKGLLTIMYNT